jgi:hypothetical protein
MPRGPKGERRPADVIGNAVKVMRIATGEEAVEGAFGADIDYAMLNEFYGASPESAKGRYSRAECIGCRKDRIEGNPDPCHVSTAYAERANLTMRMHNRRFNEVNERVQQEIREPRLHGRDLCRLV